MPLSKLHVPASLSVEICQAINDILHASLVDACGVNPDDYFCMVSRYLPGDMTLHPTYLGTRDPKATIVIEIALLALMTKRKYCIATSVVAYVRSISIRITR